MSDSSNSASDSTSTSTSTSSSSSGINSDIINNVINNVMNNINTDTTDTSDPTDTSDDTDNVSIGDIMNDITSQIKHLMKETSKAPSDFKEHYQAFISAINWNETFIYYLLLFHIILLIIMLLTRKNIDIQCGIFFIICISIYLSERINTWCHNNWQLFTTQDYFDKQGVFSSIMFSGPLLLILFIQLLNFLSLASSTLIQVKRMELKQKLQAQKANNNNSDSIDNNTNNTSNNDDISSSSNSNNNNDVPVKRRTRSSKK
jgi:hypothetical protein